MAMFNIRRNTLRYCALHGLVEMQDSLSGLGARLGEEPCPNYLSLSAKEKRKAALRQLQAIAQARRKLIGSGGGQL